MLPEIAQLLTGGVALAGLAGSIVLWAVRRIVRDEIAHALQEALPPLRTEVGKIHFELDKFRLQVAERQRAWPASRKAKEKNHEDDLA